MNTLLLRELCEDSKEAFEEDGGVVDWGDGGGDGIDDTDEDIDVDGDGVDGDDDDDEENGDVDWLEVGVVGGVGNDDEGADVLLLDEGDEIVESCSWINIIWSPNLMVKVRGERPARKLSTWKTK